MGKKGLGPKLIEETENYRVEEFIEGRVLTMLELRNPTMQTKIVELLCDTNKDKDLQQLIRSLDPSEMIHCEHFT